ncbi:NAD(P)-binding protein [Saccharata proteae CBS 121410]|uniref:NAD(P)-binding protein n=1 Tax=Saccharata proteae CBS 121410 TaxID=1314787 RepID=A0A9P4HY79_9PEZI|nr:NAD(P)-binding protein [Saccharata proteae CBS 121410]
MVRPKPSDVNAPVLSQFSLQSKVAAVTGGSRGIGLAVSRGLAEAGAAAEAIIYTSSKNAQLIAATPTSETGSSVKACQFDVTNKVTITATLNQIADEFGQLDIVVANAGIATHHVAKDYTAEQWHAFMKTNLDGASFTAQAAANIFKKQKTCSSLIFTVSVSGTLSLAVERVDFARVNCISPKFIATDMLDAHPREMADAAELKGAYVFLARYASSHTNGADMIIDGGHSLPWNGVLEMST